MLQAGLQMGNRDQSELVGPTLVGKKNEDYAGTAQWGPSTEICSHGAWALLSRSPHTKEDQDGDTHVVSVTLAISAAQ